MGKYQQRDRIARLVSWGHWFTFGNIILALLIGLLYVEAHGGAGSLVGNFYLLISWLGHFAFVPFVCFIVLLFPLCMLVPYHRILRGIGALIAAFGIFVLLFDALFFRQYGFHLNTYSLAQMSQDAEQLFTGGSFVGLLTVLFAFLLIVAAQVTLANLCWKRLDTIQQKQLGLPFTLLFVSCFFASHSIHIWADATLYTPITQQDDLFPLSYPTTAKSLMARQGWITPDTYQTQRDRLTSDTQLNLSYPLTPLLCAKHPAPRRTMIVAFDQLSATQQRSFETRLPGFSRLASRGIGHPERRSAAFQLVYGLPDLYQQQVNERAVKPAYLDALNDFGFGIGFYHSSNWPADDLPSPINSQLLFWPNLQQGNETITVLLVANQDFEAALAALRFAQLSNVQLFVTALSPTQLAVDTSTQPTFAPLHVPMWRANTAAMDRSIAAISDIVPTALASYIDCAEGFKSFTNGRAMQYGGREFPRVQSVSPRIYIFEREQTTVLDSDGDMRVFDQQGQLKIGSSPPTPVLIESLRELQRFHQGNQ